VSNGDELMLLDISRAPIAASHAMRDALAGNEPYDRQRHLPRILPVGPNELADESDAGRRRILARLTKALRGERSRGRAGHWTYDLNRHIALAQAFNAERRQTAARPRGKS
jgi:hypothetical protein